MEPISMILSFLVNDPLPDYEIFTEMDNFVLEHAT